MQKTLDILERNVQWVALGLGGILLLWAVYHYVVIPPVSAQVGNRIATADEVARLTAQGPVRSLQEQISNQRAQPPAPLDLVTPFQTAMDKTQPPNDYFVVALDVKTGKGIGGPGRENEPGVNRPQIVAQADLPAAKPGQPQTGLSVVSIPRKPLANPNPNAANAAQPVAMIAEDLAWVTVPFKISAADLKKAFEKTLNGQQVQFATAILQVQFQRQRAISVIGNNGPVFPPGDQAVEDVKALRTYQVQLKAPPPDNATKPQKYEFIQWAQAHPDMIYQPAFYDVTGGDPWTSPLQQQENAPVQNVTDQTGAGTDAGGTTPDNATQPTDTTPGAAPQSQPAAQPASGRQPAAQPAPAGRASYAPDDSDRPVDGGYDPRSAYRGRAGRGGYGRGSGGPGFNNQGNAGGNIDPISLAADIPLWAHDETARAGQVYRYRVIYVMKNPLFGTAGLAPEKLSTLLALTSPPSDWTGPVTVPAKTKFWIATVSPSNNGAKADVFQWVKGVWKANRNTALQPGDLVPGTDWTVVDVRGGTDPNRERDKYVLLTNDAGELSRRDLNTDHSDQNYKDMLDQTTPKKETEQSPAGPAPGRYYGRPMPGGRRPYGR